MAVLDLNDVASSIQSEFVCVPYYEVLATALDESDALGMGRPVFDADGAIHRFALPDETKGKKSGWAVAWADGVSTVIISSWKTDGVVKVSGTDERFRGSQNARAVTAEDMERARRRVEEAMAKREAERKAADEEAVRWSAEAYAGASPAEPDSAYPKSKGVSPLGGVRETEDGILLVPLYGSSGGMEGVQRIYADGSKKFAGGLAAKGRFAFIGDASGNLSTVLVCEGWATGCSLHMATGMPVMCAMNAGNVAPACETWLSGRPETKFIFCADNDRWTKVQGSLWNTGVEAMKAAALKFGGSVCIPDFASLEGNPTDFNDLHKREGLQAVKDLVIPEGGGVPLAVNWGVENFSGPAPAQEWLADQTLPMDSACLLAATGGTGKGMLELDLGLRVAGGDADCVLNLNKDSGWLGAKVCQKGKVLIISAEDNRDDIHRRLQSIDPDGSRRERAKGNLFIVPLPDDGGPFPLVKAKKGWHQGYETTPQFDSIVRQAKKLKNVKLIVIDPLASFVAIDVNADPQAGAFVQGALARLAKQTGGACVLLAHHMRKAGDKGAKSAEEARDLIRGTTALVDGVRLALAVWPADARAKKAASKAFDRPVSPHDVFCAAVVKSNCPSNNAVKTLVRQPNGLLKAFVPSEGSGTFRTSELLDTLVSAVRIKCDEGRPLAATGMSGVYARRDELPDPLCEWSRHRLEDAVQDLLKAGRIVRCQVGKTAKWLDVPEGPLASKPEDYEFADGSTSGEKVPLPGTGKDGKSW